MDEGFMNELSRIDSKRKTTLMVSGNDLSDYLCVLCYQTATIASFLIILTLILLFRYS